jgi:C1A family cysteine protease
MADLHHGFGWHPDTPDHRDYTAMEPQPSSIPKLVDLSQYAGPVLDQGQLGSCTAHGTAGVFEWLDNKDGRKVEMISRLFQYYNTRALEGTVDSDSGGTIRDAVKAAATSGECPEDTWPYDIAKFAVTPPANCYVTAKTDKALTYWRVRSDPFPGATCLVSGFPVVFGFVVYESFESATDGIIPMPEPGEAPIGGHCVWQMGYSFLAAKYQPARTVKCRNSWGPDWGQAGNFYLPMAYVQRAQLASDFWTIRRVGQG